MPSRFNPINVSNFNPERSYLSRRRHPFNDKRRHATWVALGEGILSSGSCIVNRCGQNRAESARFYRFLRNPQVAVEELIYMNCRVKTQVLEGRHVLVLGDTTAYNLKSHLGRIQDAGQVGVIDSKNTPGFMSHVHLALDACSEDVLGLSDVLLWCRPKSKAKKVPSYLQHQEDKESYKWFLGIDNASRVLQAAACRSFILDRDADNYDLFLKFYQEGKDHFVIRSRWDRQVQYLGQQQPMSHCLNQAPCLGSYTIQLPALNHYSSTWGRRIQRRARQATVEVRAIPIAILPPSTPLHAGGPALPLYLIEAREIDSPSLSKDKDEPILWRLISNHVAESFLQATTLIRFYALRWVIEQLFRTAKTEGFDLEATPLETLDAIERQTVMTLHAAAKVLQLVYARGKVEAQPIEEVFEDEERTVLSLINQQYQGKTDKQKNPYPESKTSWATWIIARLGGWKGYESQRPPGPITIKRGLEQFYVFLKAFQMMKPSG